MSSIEVTDDEDPMKLRDASGAISLDVGTTWKNTSRRSRPRREARMTPGEASSLVTVVDLKGRLSNPPDLPETPVAQEPEPVGGASGGVGTTRIRPSVDHAEGPREE